MDTNNIYYTIKRIKDIYFSINEQLFADDPDKIIKIELGNRLGFNIEGNLVSLILRVHFHYVGESEILVDSQVENTFEVDNLARFQDEKGLILLPPMLITSIVGLCISHGRAILLKNTAGSLWQQIIVPITNPEEVAKYFFPYMFIENYGIVPKPVQLTKEKQSAKKRKVAKH